MTTVTPIARHQGIKKNIFEQALDKAKAVISGEKTDAIEKAKVEPATTQIKTNVEAAKPDAYVTPKQASETPKDKPADSNTVKELWNKAVKVIQEDVVKPVETTVKKITGSENGKPKTEDIKLKLGNTSNVKNAAGTDETINEVASAEQIKAVQAEVARNANTILNHATKNNEPVKQKPITYEDLQAELNKAKDTKKPIYESNIDLSSNDNQVKQRNEEIKQAWMNLEKSHKMVESYRKSLDEDKDKDEIKDIKAQEDEVSKQLLEIEKLQANLRNSVSSTITLTNGARLTNDGVENGKGIKQLSSEELKGKGIQDPEKLLGTDNAFIEYESKDKDDNAITKQHLVNSKVDGSQRVTNITTDAQDLNGDGVINNEELPSQETKPLEKIIGNFDNNQNLKDLHLSSVQFNGNKEIIPPSAENGVGQEYTNFYGNIPDGKFKTLKLSKGDTAMVVESLDGDEFWKHYTADHNLNSIIAATDTVTTANAASDTQNPTNIGRDYIKLSLSGEEIRGTRQTNPEVTEEYTKPKDVYTFTLSHAQLQKLISINAADPLAWDARWLNNAYIDNTLDSYSTETSKSFGNYDVITKNRDSAGNFTYELNLSSAAYERFQDRASKWTVGEKGLTTLLGG